MRLGYARVSAVDQDLSHQRQALAEAGCDRIVEEFENGIRARSRLTIILTGLTAGDELVVESMVQLGRDAGEVVVRLDEQRKRGVVVRILNLPWLDYSAPVIPFIAQPLEALAELEREHRRERKDRVHREGRHLGRPPKLTAAQTRDAEQMVANDCPPAEVARHFHVHPRTLKAALRRLGLGGQTAPRLRLYQRSADYDRRP